MEESKKTKEKKKEAVIIDNNAAVNLAFEMTEETLKNPFFPVDFDTYCSTVR